MRGKYPPLLFQFFYQSALFELLEYQPDVLATRPHVLLRLDAPPLPTAVPATQARHAGRPIDVQLPHDACRPRVPPACIIWLPQGVRARLGKARPCGRLDAPSFMQLLRHCIHEFLRRNIPDRCHCTTIPKNTRESAVRLFCPQAFINPFLRHSLPATPRRTQCTYKSRPGSAPAPSRSWRSTTRSSACKTSASSAPER